MRIACGTVSGYGDPCDPSVSKQHKERLDLYHCVVDRCAACGIDLVCFPAGYFRTNNQTHLQDLSKELARVAKTHGLAVAVGIDVKTKVAHPECTLIERYCLPWFAVCWSPTERVLQCWRQRSSTSKNYRYAPERANQEQRTMLVGRSKVEILICGEVFNPLIRTNIIERRAELHVVIDLGLYSRGFRVWAGMKKLARGGLTSLCSVHTEKRHGRKYRYDPGPRRKSTYDCDIELGTRPRAEFKVWQIP